MPEPLPDVFRPRPRRGSSDRSSVRDRSLVHRGFLHRGLLHRDLLHRGLGPLLLVFLLGLGAPWAMPDSAAAKGWPEPARGGLSEVPSFFIERIRVENLRRATPDLVIAESLLLEGQTYDEIELRQAVFRIQRLPFVLDAGFSLAKGSERGRYELVITVEEIRRFFFGEDAVFTHFTNSVAFDTLFARDWSVSPGPLAGVRFFVGRYGVLFGSVAGGRGFQAGYTHYDLFGRRGFLSLGLTANGCCQVQVFPLGLDPTFSSWQNEGDSREARLTVGLPLEGDLGVRFEVVSQASEEGERRSLLGLDRPRGTLEYEDLAQRRASLALTYDSTDDPVFPSQGISASLGLDYTWAEADLRVLEPLFGVGVNEIELPPGEDGLVPDYRSEQVRLGFEVAQHWQPWSRHTVSLSARVAAGQARVRNLPVLDVLDVVDCPDSGSNGGVLGGSGCAGNRLRVIDDEEMDLFEGYFTARHSMSLWGHRPTRERGDFRLETTLEFGYDRTSPDLELPDNPLYRKSITTSLVFRNSWGLFRVSFQVADYGRGF